MASVFQLYGRPLAEDTPLPPLRIEGDLGGHISGEEYEGRLQIIDSVGKCKVEIVSSTLPPGAYALVDNFTKEIVLRWPPYTEPDNLATVVPNGDFEEGDNGAWYKSAGWSIGSGAGFDTFSGTHSAVYRDNRGSTSLIGTPVPVVPGTSITATCQVQQGASSAGKAGARILLVWYDENKQPLPGGEGIGRVSGNTVNSGSNSQWHPSSVTGTAPPNAAYVGVEISAYRRSQNKPLWVDAITWNHTYSTGTNSEEEFSVTFKVTDSANRVAYWAGTVSSLFEVLTGQLLPFFEYESVSISAAPVSMNWKESPAVSVFEAVSLTATPVSLVFRVPVTEFSDVESVSLTATPLSMNWRSVRILANDTESVSITATPRSINYKTHITHSATPETVSLTATPLGMNYG